MLFDPFEEQFHVPTFAVEFCYGQGFITEMVCQETVDVAGGEVFVSDHPQFFGITPGGLVGSELDDLISYDAGVLVNGIGLEDIILHIVLRPGNEERSVLVYPVEETEEVNISLIHHIDGTHFYAELIQHPDIVDGSICEIDECRDVATKVEKRMHLHASLGLAESGPWTELQAETDGAAVEGIDRIVQIKPEGGIISIERPHSFNENLTEVPVDTPVAELICLSQCVARNSVTDTAHIQFMGDSRQARFDVPETVLVRVLRHTHDQELVVAGEVPDTIVPFVSGYAIVELASWNEGHELGKHCASLVHRGWDSGLCRKTIDSNRVHQEMLISN